MSVAKTNGDVRVGAKTHTGLVREENQDAMTRFFCTHGEVLLVADGMGGHKGGRLAAEMVARGFEELLSTVDTAQSLEASLREVTTRVNRQIREKALSGSPETAKMGSTLVLAVIKDGRVTVAHVGDSRAYLLRGDELTRLTKDHSRIQKMVDHGLLTEEQAREHPDSNILIRSVGTQDQVEIEISPAVSIKRGDMLMICSDGLHGYISDERIREACLAETEVQGTADMLLSYALKAGGEDNVTVQVVQFGTRRRRTYHPPKQHTSGKHPWLLPLAGLGLVVVGIGTWLLLAKGAKAAPATTKSGEEVASTEKGAANVTSTEKGVPKAPPGVVKTNQPASQPMAKTPVPTVPEPAPAKAPAGTPTASPQPLAAAATPASTPPPAVPNAPIPPPAAPTTTPSAGNAPVQSAPAIVPETKKSAVPPPKPPIPIIQNGSRK